MRQIVRTTIRDAAWIVIISAVLGLSANTVNPRGYSLVKKSAERQKSLVRISALEAKIKYDASSALFLDARGRDEYESSRIAGAVSVPASPESLSLQRISEEHGALRGNRELVIYCGGSACGDSDTLASRIAGLGYSRHIYILQEGFPSWEGAGYPVRGSGGGER
ncbi:MAG: rhodanese-like domain-containing protein [Spirochaetes bacterium]|nr:rhodanese-like domain-containing protein [Spirochaetota bacterium]